MKKLHFTAWSINRVPKGHGGGAHFWEISELIFIFRQCASGSVTRSKKDTKLEYRHYPGGFIELYFRRGLTLELDTVSHNCETSKQITQYEGTLLS